MSRFAMIVSVISAININKDIQNPALWFCLIGIGFLYVLSESKNENQN